MPLRPEDERFIPELRRLREAGVDVVGLNIGFGSQGVEEHLRMLAHFRRWLKARPQECLLVGSVEDALLARKSGRLGVFFDIEGANAIADQLSLIEMYYDLGVRWMLVAYNLNNRAGGGCLDDDPGLSPFGAEMIDEMNRVGMMLCCSHTGERTALDAIARSAAPVIFSHSNPRAVGASAQHPRSRHSRLRREGRRYRDQRHRPFLGWRRPNRRFRAVRRLRGRASRHRPRGHRHRLRLRYARTHRISQD
jgi:membrane dipeptidase